MPLTIIDTDILIDQGRGISEAADFLDRLESTSLLAISVVTQMELTVGCRNKTEQRELSTILNRFRILSITAVTLDDLEKDCRVQVKVMRNDKPEFVTDVVQATNNQNPMAPRNVKSNERSGEDGVWPAIRAIRTRRCSLGSMGRRRRKGAARSSGPRAGQC